MTEGPIAPLATAALAPGRTSLFLGVALLLLILLVGTEGGRTFLGLRTSEEHDFLVLLEEGPYEVRSYSPSVQASTRVMETHRDPMGVGFRRLAGYIFGGNDREEPIAMTIPVRTHRGTAADEAALRMSFVIPRERRLEDLPTPDDPRVRLAEAAGGPVAVLRYRGIPRRSDLGRLGPGLRAWVAEKGLAPAGDLEQVFFDPPWTLPFLRRNELHLPVHLPTAPEGRP